MKQKKTLIRKILKRKKNLITLNKYDSNDVSRLSEKKQIRKHSYTRKSIQIKYVLISVSDTFHIPSLSNCLHEAHQRRKISHMHDTSQNFMQTKLNLRFATITCDFSSSLQVTFNIFLVLKW